MEIFVKFWNKGIPTDAQGIPGEKGIHFRMVSEWKPFLILVGKP
jgi:hypothetical protein